MLRLSLAAILLFAPGVLLAQSNPPAPAATGSATARAVLPQDRHGGLTISVDSYTNSDRAKEKFGKSANPVPAGILPIEVQFKNETPHPIKIDLETVQLEVRLDEGKHQELDWLTAGQVANLIIHPGGNPGTPSAKRFPIGIPTPSKDKKIDKLAADLRPLALDSDVVPPLGSIHGFLFFNMSHNFDAALKSSLYVPDVALLPDRTPLMFFEVPLTSNAALSTAPVPEPQR